MSDEKEDPEEYEPETGGQLRIIEKAEKEKKRETKRD